MKMPFDRIFIDGEGVDFLIFDNGVMTGIAFLWDDQKAAAVFADRFAIP